MQPGWGFSDGTQAPPAVKVVVYGVEGVGKSTFAAGFPNPTFIDVEGSTRFLSVRRFDPPPASWTELLEMVNWSIANMSPGTTLVVDTLDWSERLCSAHVCNTNGWASIEAPGYGKGYKYMQEEFTKLLDGLTAVARNGVNVVCTAHAKISKFELPDECGAYDRWSLKLTDTKSTSIASMVKEWADVVLFANYETIVEKTDSGKAKARGNARVMYTSHDACWDAKNRWGLAPKVPFEFASIAAFVPGMAGQAELQDLMAIDGVTEDELRRAVASQRIMPSDVAVADYPPDVVSRLVARWQSVHEVVKELRTQEDIPFN